MFISYSFPTPYHFHRIKNNFVLIEWFPITTVVQTKVITTMTTYALNQSELAAQSAGKQVTTW